MRIEKPEGKIISWLSPWPTLKTRISNVPGVQGVICWAFVEVDENTIIVAKMVAMSSLMLGWLKKWLGPEARNKSMVSQ